mmetsp:Transcript_94214/g.218873  ORF Transcript_94214/g.218873 Transcript_94214/m.218873 type:complete len:256 (-) Transcript_94214:166-933(-)
MERNRFSGNGPQSSAAFLFDPVFQSAYMPPPLFGLRQPSWPPQLLVLENSLPLLRHPPSSWYLPRLRNCALALALALPLALALAFPLGVARSFMTLRRAPRFTPEPSLDPPTDFWVFSGFGFRFLTSNFSKSSKLIPSFSSVPLAPAGVGALTDRADTLAAEAVEGVLAAHAATSEAPVTATVAAVAVAFAAAAAALAAGARAWAAVTRRSRLTPPRPPPLVSPTFSVGFSAAAFVSSLLVSTFFASTTGFRTVA